MGKESNVLSNVICSRSCSIQINRENIEVKTFLSMVIGAKQNLRAIRIKYRRPISFGKISDLFHIRAIALATKISSAEGSTRFCFKKSLYFFKSSPCGRLALHTILVPSGEKLAPPSYPGSIRDLF
jgi:hypothetical protein